LRLRSETETDGHRRPEGPSVSERAAQSHRVPHSHCPDPAVYPGSQPDPSVAGEMQYNTQRALARTSERRETRWSMAR